MKTRAYALPCRKFKRHCRTPSEQARRLREEIRMMPVPGLLIAENLKFEFRHASLNRDKFKIWVRRDMYTYHIFKMSDENGQIKITEKPRNELRVLTSFEIYNRDKALR